MNVYVVTAGYNYEGEQVDSVWSTPELAKKRAMESDVGGDTSYVYCEPVDGGCQPDSCIGSFSYGEWREWS